MVEERCVQCPVCSSNWREDSKSFEEQAGEDNLNKQDGDTLGEAETTAPAPPESTVSAVLELRERLDALADALSQPGPPGSEEDLAAIAESLEECEAAGVTLRILLDKQAKMRQGSSWHSKSWMCWNDCASCSPSTVLGRV